MKSRNGAITKCVRCTSEDSFVTNSSPSSSNNFKHEKGSSSLLDSTSEKIGKALLSGHVMLDEYCHNCNSVLMMKKDGASTLNETYCVNCGELSMEKEIPTITTKSSAPSSDSQPSSLLKHVINDKIEQLTEILRITSPDNFERINSICQCICNLSKLK